MRSTSSIIIDLAALDRNLQAIRAVISPQCDLCAVVKADAYGLGAPRIAKQLAASGASMLAVYSLPQAEAISAAGVTIPQLVLMPVREIEVTGECHRLLLAARLHLVVHGASHARELAAISDQLGGGPIPVHLEVDTGMSRGGATVSEAGRVLALIADERRLRLAGIFTHFSDSRGDGGRTHSQMDEFERLLIDHAHHIPDEASVHVANSHAALRHPRFHRSMIRTGLAWTGLAQDPACDVDRVAGEESCELEFALPSLESIVRWESTIVHTKTIESSVAVGYGSRWKSTRPTRLGVIPVGYFDGYPVASGVSEDRWIRIDTGSRSYEVPVVGAINMDQCVVDITDVPPSIAYGDGFVGMTAEIYGADARARNYLPRVAKAVGAHAYELLCRMTPRIGRKYIEDANATAQIDHRRVLPSSSAMTA
ncbi:MAG: alanine racemase [Phycisphaerales bacterium]|nr:alanine racemase [Phycisphaerales bacterium]